MKPPLLAIDPGTEESAILIWTGREVSKPLIMPNSALLDYLRVTTIGLPLAVEMVACYGMAVGKEVFETCLVIGRIHEIWSAKGLPLRFVYRRDTKMHLCASMRAKDANVRQALIDKLGKVGTKKAPGPLYGVSSHLWSALAVAITASET